MSTYLVGKDKSSFLNEAYKSLPSGNELLTKVQEYLQSIDGYKWMIAKATGKDIEINEKNIESFIPAIEYMLGVEPSEEAPKDKDANEEEESPLAQE